MIPKSNASTKYYIYIVLSMLFWGMSFIWTRIALADFNPITVILFRLILSSLILLLVIKISRSQEKIAKEDRKWFLLLALSEPFFYFLGENFGLQYVSPAITSAIIATIPLITPIVAFIFLKEKIDKYLVSGVLLSFFGIIYMLVNPDLSLNASSKGIALIFLAVFSAVAYTFFIRKLAHKYKAITILTLQNIIGAIYFLPIFLIFDVKELMVSHFSLNAILAIVQLAIFASSIAFLLFIIVVAKLGMIKANIFTNLIPVFTAIFAYFIIGEMITLQKAIGIILVITGILISQIPAVKTIYNRVR
ncbi:MAG: DMT family transporter [Omnitrophica WOR_2 bacterium]|jgi:drug/metabolite transporter (DMT)-like permease